ncbi:MAG: FAD:protein FMN transferase [Desulfocapsaceae bacterium]
MKSVPDARFDASCNTRRRELLKLSGLLGLAALSAPLLPTENAEALWFNRKNYKVSKTRLSMGTFVSMTAIHNSKDRAEEAFAAAFNEIQELASVLSRHDEASPVAELNRTGILESGGDDLVRVVSRALHYNQLTGGVFDITVKPLMDLYQQSFETGQKPTEQEIEKTLGAIGSGGLQLETNRISFERPGMGITLDGIAKGYIVDRASKILGDHGVTNHLVNAGGDIRTSGSAAGDKKWTIAIQDPAKKREFPDIIKMGDGAVATSGNYEAYYDQEKLFHHIVDPHTGHSPQVSSSVSVTAPTVMDADALATALFVLEPREAVDLIEKVPDGDCFIIDREAAVYKSSSWLG